MTSNSPDSLLSNVARTFVYGFITIATTIALFQITVETHQPYGFDESSMIEILQLFYLGVCTALFLLSARTKSSQKTLSILLAGMVVVALVREMDHYFDEYVFDGAWQTAVSLLVVAIAWYVIKFRGGLKLSILEFSSKASFGYMASAFFIIFVYSRIIGMQTLWKVVLGENYLRISKTLVQEGTELFGYALLMIAATEFFVETKKSVSVRC